MTSSPSSTQDQRNPEEILRQMYLASNPLQAEPSVGAYFELVTRDLFFNLATENQKPSPDALMLTRVLTCVSTVAARAHKSIEAVKLELHNMAGLPAMTLPTVTLRALRHREGLFTVKARFANDALNTLLMRNIGTLEDSHVCLLYAESFEWEFGKNLLPTGTARPTCWIKDRTSRQYHVIGQMTCLATILQQLSQVATVEVDEWPVLVGPTLEYQPAAERALLGHTT